MFAFKTVMFGMVCAEAVHFEPVIADMVRRGFGGISLIDSSPF
jgi:hypothetical protein